MSFDPHWQWPQWTYAVMLFIPVMMAASQHGEPRAAYSFPLALLHTSLAVILLICGGFFR